MAGVVRRGRPREADLREIISALRYLVRSGCGWEMLPVHFGPWQTVYWWFRRLMRRFLFQTIHDLALGAKGIGLPFVPILPSLRWTLRDTVPARFNYAVTSLFHYAMNNYVTT
jgi:hypothetical protein